MGRTAPSYYSEVARLWDFVARSVARLAPAPNAREVAALAARLGRQEQETKLLKTALESALREHAAETRMARETFEALLERVSRLHAELRQLEHPSAAPAGDPAPPCGSAS